MIQQDIFDLGDVVTTKEFIPKLKQEDFEKNSKIELLYRDANNHKFYAREIVKGVFTASQLEQIREKLEDNHFFIADQVGLRGGVDLAKTKGYTLSDDDHVYTTFCAFYDGEQDPLSKIEQTMEEPTVDFDVTQLTNRFVATKFWDIAFEMSRTGLDSINSDCTMDEDEEEF